MAITVERYTPDDLPALTAVWNEVVREGVAFPQLEELTPDEFAAYSPLFGQDVYDAIDLVNCCEGRTSYGGHSAASVRRQIAQAEAALAAWEEAQA